MTGEAQMERKPWFLVMTAANANQPGSGWMRAGAASRGKVVARPIAPEGWLTLLGFIVLLIAAPLLWLGGLLTGYISLVEAIVMTILSLAVIVGGLVWIIRTRSTRLPPHSPR
jgi:hypothetical protein